MWHTREHIHAQENTKRRKRRFKHKTRQDERERYARRFDLDDSKILQRLVLGWRGWCVCVDGPWDPKSGCAMMRLVVEEADLQQFVVIVIH